MKKIFTLLMIFTIACFTAKSFAGYNAGGYTSSDAGGFTGESKARFTTVLEARKMGDNAYVSLKGKITSKTGKEKYLFKDNTGTIEIEIDDKDWGGVKAGPKDTVIIEGEIDREWNSITVDVDRIMLAK